MSQPINKVTDAHFVSDEQFMGYLNRFFSARNSLLENGTPFSDQDQQVLDLDDLRMLCTPKGQNEEKQARSPTPDEWNRLEKARMALAKYLTTETNTLISNDQFMEALNQLINTRNSLLGNGSPFDAHDQEILKLNDLRKLRTPKNDDERRQARPPMPDEWNKLEAARLTLAKYIASETNRVISDGQFMDSLRQLIITRDFLIDNGTSSDDRDPEALKLTDLRKLRTPKDDTETRQARPPTPDEWNTLETAKLMLAKYNTPEMRRLWNVREARTLIRHRPRALLSLVILGFACAILSYSPFKEILDKAIPAEAGLVLSSALRIVGVVTWTLALGGLGSAAFLGVSTLSVRNDATFDIADSTLIRIRMSLGSVFGFILSLPFSTIPFLQFADSMARAGKASEQPNEITVATIAQILLPFFLGFSTSLVLAVLDRFIGAVESLFGVRGGATTGTRGGG